MIRSPWRGRSGDIGAWRTDCTGSWMSLSARTTAGCGTAPPPATSPCCARSPSTWWPRIAAAEPAYAAGARRPPGTTTTCSSSSSATLMREPCQRVPFPGVVEHRLQLGPVALRAGCLLGVEPLAAGRLQGVELEGVVLLPRGHARVPDEHGPSRNLSERATRERHVSRDSYGTPDGAVFDACPLLTDRASKTEGYRWRSRPAERKPGGSPPTGSCRRAPDAGLQRPPADFANGVPLFFVSTSAAAGRGGRWWPAGGGAWLAMAPVHKPGSIAARDVDET